METEDGQTGLCDESERVNTEIKRLADALDLFRARDPLELVAQEFGIPSRQLEAALRASLPAAA